MARSVYITAAEPRTGKSTVALGVLDVLQRVTPRVGVFRPISSANPQDDWVLALLLEHDGVSLSADQCVGVTYQQMTQDPDAALATIVARYKKLEAQCDAVVIVGSDFGEGTGSGSGELLLNAAIATNLGAPVLLVLNGRQQNGNQEQLGSLPARDSAEMQQVAQSALNELKAQRSELFAVVINRAEAGELDSLHEAVSGLFGADTSGTSDVSDVSGTSGASGTSIPLIWTVPEDARLVAPPMRSVVSAVQGRVLRGDAAALEREVQAIVVAGMSMVNVLPRLLEGSVVVIAADRTEVLIATLLAHESASFPNIAGIVLNGPFPLPEEIERLIDGAATSVPIIATDFGTYETAFRVMSTRSRMAADSPLRYERALELFHRHIDLTQLTQALGLAHSEVVTPLMFQYSLMEQARAHRQHIVLPEGSDDRIIRAAAVVLSRDVAELTLLGDEDLIRGRAAELGVDISGARVISPLAPELVAKFATEYARIRAHKGITTGQATDIVTDVSYFGTMMVHLGLADGMVSGAVHTTAHTIRPAFEIIKTKPGVRVVSSVFLMALADRVLVYGDCAVIPDPTSSQLADIAISSADTAQQFGIDPRVAMLSYSTGTSGSGAEVEKVRLATELVKERDPDLPVEGPIQYDAATDAVVARAKLPGSAVAGKATVFIFPDLNTGNNTYKAVQRSAGAVAMGPVLQGLNKPINDLSRGALVEDIVNTVVITAIQAQSVQVQPVGVGSESKIAAQ